MWMAPASYYDDNSNGALSADADRADLLARLLVPPLLLLITSFLVPIISKHQKQLDNISMVKCTHSS